MCARILVTGGLGFVGQHLTRFFILRGHSVSVLTRRSVSSSIPLTDPSVAVVTTDWSVPSLVRAMEEVQPDGVVHLAGVTDVALSWRQPLHVVETNIGLAARLLEAIRTASLYAPPRVLLVGSMHEYTMAERAPTPYTETSHARPGNPYGWSKLQQTMMGTLYADLYSLPVAAVRVFNLCGPGAERGVIAELMKRTGEVRAGLHDATYRIGSVEMARDFLDVRDAVRAFATLLQTDPFPVGEVFNVCSGHPTRLGEVVAMLSQVLGVEYPIRIDPSLVRPGEPTVVFGSHAKLTRVTGWKPQISMHKSLEDSWRQTLGKGEIHT